ncbi:hypothetical protein BGX34_003935 [Mortierella sp. NVP85]|nr:hypothetical protein BGX34_003935 [Mortierella sp. NVP85]
MPSNLDAISESAMDEDLDADNTSLLVASSAHLSVPSTGNNGGNSSDGSNSSDNADSDSGEDDNTAGDHGEDGEDEDQDGSDSDDEHDSTANDRSQDSGGSKDRANRPRVGITPRKKRPSIGSLSAPPSNLIRIVSATPSKKIAKKSKKSVKPKGSKGSLNNAATRQASEEAKLEAAKPIVSRFLELENPKLNEKMLQVFMINGMIPFVIESITRLDPEIAKDLSNDMEDDTNQDSKFMRHVEHCRRTRDFSDMELMKKSYTAMNFLIRNDVYNEFILSGAHQLIVKELFKIFRPESNGNFYHFQKVYELILKKFRAQTMETLFESVDTETGLAKMPLIFDMLPFLDQGPVALSMVRTLFPTYTYGIAEKIPDYYRVLQNGRFVEMLLAMVTLTQEPPAGIADFIVSLLDEATRAKDAKTIFSCLADDPIWAERIMQGAQSSSTVKRRGCIEIIYSVLVRSIQVPFQDLLSSSIYITEKPADRAEPHMERIANEFGKHLARYIPDLCRIFIGSKASGEQISLPGYTVSSSFTVTRLWLLDSLYHCLNDVKDDPALLDSIPESFWSTLVDSFIDFRFNNAFHVQFYKLFRVVLYSEQAPVYDRLFTKTNFVTRLIEHYRTSDQPTGSRGYIILILNCIRLSAEVEAQRAENTDGREPARETQEGLISPTFWTDHISANSEWEDFQATLRQVTLEQTSDTFCNMDPNLRFQFAPLQSRQPTEAPLTKRHIGIPGVSARGNEGIDLGSQYGNSLGFGVPMRYDRAVEEPEKVEEDQRTPFEKARADLMANISGMNWKLIPPQRVINAMLGLAQGRTTTENSQPSTNGANGHASTVSESVVSKESGSNGDAATNDGTQASSKAKKKKKNKKKRQGNGGTTEDASLSTDGDDNQHDTDSDTQSPHDGSTESEESRSNQKQAIESNGEHVNSSIAPTDLEAERRERKREKNREKKRKSKMNKKNRISQSSEHSQPDSSPSTTDEETMEL